MEQEIPSLDQHLSFILNSDYILNTENKALKHERQEPMNSSDITIPSGVLELRGTLATGGSTPGPAALLISGSGPIDRDSNAKRLKLGVMGQFAARLSEAGITSLRYDKRGVAQSQGEYLAAGMHDNIADARAALDVLRARPEVDPDRIFVVGHSEGALIASELGATPGLAGVVLLAGAARNGKEILRWQAGRVAATLPKPVKWIVKLLRQDIVRTQSKRLERIEASTEDVIRIQFVKVNAKWFREFLAFDPSRALRRMAAPVLALTGDKDIQVDPAEVAMMEHMVPTPFTGHVVEDVTHLLRSESGPASLRTYKKQARRPLDNRVCELVTAWIATHSRDKNGAGRDQV